MKQFHSCKAVSLMHSKIPKAVQRSSLISSLESMPMLLLPLMNLEIRFAYLLVQEFMTGMQKPIAVKQESGSLQQIGIS